MELEYVTPQVAVRGQIEPEEIAGLAKAGFKTIINNRPDHEQPGQPLSDDLGATARQHGLAYWHIPVVPGQATEADAAAFARAIDAASGPVVAFCRTGGRARSLWQMAQASD